MLSNSSRLSSCQRHNLLADIKERFGEDVFERMERDGSIPQTMKVDGNKIDWTLHQKVQSFLKFHFLCGIMAEMYCGIDPGLVL